MDAIGNSVIAPEEARPYVLVSEGIEPAEVAFKKHTETKKKESIKVVKNIEKEDNNDKEE